MSRYSKTFSPRTIRFEEQDQMMYEDDKKDTYEPIKEEDVKTSILDAEASKITYKPFKNQAFKKIEDGKSCIKDASSGSHVLLLNQALNKLGYAVSETDMIFWDNTLKALLEFQSAQGLLQTHGEFNAETLLAMDKELEALENLDSSIDIKEKEKDVVFETQLKEEEEKYISFVIPVPREMTPRESHIHIFRTVFNVGHDRAVEILDDLLASKGSYAEIWKLGFTKFTEEDIKRGYKTFNISIVFYNKYASVKIVSEEEFKEELFPDREEQMQWFDNLKNGDAEQQQLRRTIIKTTDERFTRLTGVQKIKTNQHHIQLYNEMLYEEIKSVRGSNPHGIHDFRTRERVQALIDTFTPEQKEIFDDLINNPDSEASYYSRGNFDDSFEHFTRAFDEYYRFWNDRVSGEHLKDVGAGKYDNFDAFIEASLNRLDKKQPFTKHSGVSKGERYHRLKEILKDDNRSDDVLVTLVRGLNQDEQQQFWNDANTQNKLSNALKFEALVQAIATHHISYQTKANWLSKRKGTAVSYAIYRELIYHSINGEAILRTFDEKFKSTTFNVFLHKGELGALSDIGTPEYSFDPLLKDEALEMPSLQVLEEEEDLRDLIIAWKAESGEMTDFGLRYTKKEQAYDEALETNNISESAFEERAEKLEAEFLPWFQDYAVRQVYTIMDASEQFIYAEFNKIASRGVTDLISDMKFLAPQFELLGVLFNHWYFGKYYTKNRKGELIELTLRGQYGEKYELLRRKISSFLQSRHPLLYDAHDGDLYDIHKLYNSYLKDPVAFEADMLERFEEELGKTQESIFETRENIRVDGEDVWKLTPVILYSLRMLQLQGTGYEAIILSKLQESSGVPLWVYAGLIALTIVGGPLGAAAVIGLAAASVVDVAIEYHDYDIKSDASGAVVTNAADLQKLSDDPSVIWLAIAIAGLALDIFPAIKAFGKLSKVGKIESAADLTKFNKELDEFAQVEKLSDRIKSNLKKQAELELTYKKTVNELKIRLFEVNAGINPNSLPIFIELAGIFVKRGVNTFQRFLLELKLQKIIKNIDSLTDEELKILKEAFESATKVKDKVVGKVDGLYEGINPNNTPKGFKFTDSKVTAYGFEGIETIISKGDLSGYFIRLYDPKTNTLLLHHGFLEDLPKWIDDVKVPLVKGKGIPTQTYATLRQMKLLGIADNSLENVALKQVQNLETMCFIAEKMEKGIINSLEDAGKVLNEASSMRYVKTTMEQAGYDLGAITVSKRSDTYIFTARELKLEFDVTEDLLKRYNLTWDSKIPINFDINIKLESIQ